jgi:hypothetical protein
MTKTSRVSYQVTLLMLSYAIYVINVALAEETPTPKKRNAFVLYQDRANQGCQKGNVEDCIAHLNFNDYLSTSTDENIYTLHERIKFHVPWDLLLIHFNYWGLFGDYDEYASSSWKRKTTNSNLKIKQDFIAHFYTKKKYNGESLHKPVTLEIFRIPINDQLQNFLNKKEMDGFNQNLVTSLKELYFKHSVVTKMHHYAIQELKVIRNLDITVSMIRL